MNKTKTESLKNKVYDSTYKKNIFSIKEIDKEKTYRLSIFTHILEKKSIIAIYHSISSEIIYYDKKIKKILQKFKNGMSLDNFYQLFNQLNIEGNIEEFCEILINKKMIVPIFYSEDEELKNVQKEENPRVKSMDVLILILTENCNLRCSYCHNNYANYKLSDAMSFETAKNALLYFSNNIKLYPQKNGEFDSPYIIFYGGEPLLNKQVFYDTVNYINELISRKILPTLTDIILNTNGTLLDMEICNFLLNNKISVVISLDGTKKVNDKNRIHSDKKGTFDEIINAIKLLSDAGVDFTISSTISNQNYKNIYKTMKYFIKNIDCQHFCFNLLIDNDKEHKSFKYIKYVTKKLKKIYLLCNKHQVVEGLTMPKVEDLMNKRFVINDCGGFGRQMVVKPNGNFGPCQCLMQYPECFPYSLEKDLNFENIDLFPKLRKKSPLYLPQCKNCLALGNCGGFCYVNAYRTNGCLYGNNEIDCYFSIEFLKFLIWEIFNQLS